MTAPKEFRLVTILCRAETPGERHPNAWYDIAGDEIVVKCDCAEAREWSSVPASARIAQFQAVIDRAKEAIAKLKNPPVKTDDVA